MHDIRMIRDNPAAFDAALSRRGIDGLSSQILTLDEERRAKILAAETAQADANAAAKQVGAAKAPQSWLPFTGHGHNVPQLSKAKSHCNTRDGI